MTAHTPLLDVRDLHIPGIVASESFTIRRGEKVGLVGESGSGKTLTAWSIMGLVPPGITPTGSIQLADGPNLLTAPERQLREVRGARIAMIVQEPMTALDPLMRIGYQVREVMTVHGMPKAAAHRRAEQLLADVGVPRFTAYPHELSGGQRQRVLIAMALANEPDLLICDEPTTALDVTVQQRIIELISSLVERTHTALLFITHDLPLVNQITDRLLVLHRGRIVESGPTARVLTSPQDPYTRALVAASRLGPRTPSRKTSYALVAAHDVSRTYPGGGGVRDVSLTLTRGQRLGIVGESGAGKSTLLNLIAGLDRPDGGSLHVGSQVVVSQVFQDPAASLDPRMRIRDIVAEPIRAWPRQRRLARVREVLAEVGLPGDEVLTRYPHEFSGGQRQRISIARALANRPGVLLADEPVSALDVSVRGQILDLLARLVAEYGLALVFVSHDLRVTRHLCEDVIVMKDGRIVEQGPTDQVWEHPSCAYTAQLLAAVAPLPGAPE